MHYCSTTPGTQSRSKSTITAIGHDFCICWKFIWFLKSSHLFGDISGSGSRHAGNKALFILLQGDQVIPIKAACVVYWGWGRVSQTQRSLILQEERRKEPWITPTWVCSNEHWGPLSSFPTRQLNLSVFIQDFSNFATCFWMYMFLLIDLQN